MILHCLSIKWLGRKCMADKMIVGVVVIQKWTWMLRNGCKCWCPGPVVQHLTKLLANVMLNFLEIVQIHRYFCWKKNNMQVAFAFQKLLTFLQQNINVFENTLATTVNECVIHKLIKLMINQNDALAWTTCWVNMNGKPISSSISQKGYARDRNTILLNQNF